MSTNVAPAEYISLGKWPAMTVLGKTITPDEAAQVILRTNNWYDTTNDRSYKQSVYQLVGLKPNICGGVCEDSLDELRRAWKSLDLQYLSNHRIMSCWLGGVHGWCHWSGAIRSNNYNIGKWPSVAEVAQEWKDIAQAFPFLDLTCQLWSAEVGDTVPPVPLVEYVVKDGKVETTAPSYPELSPAHIEVDSISGIGIALDALAIRMQSAGLARI